jgi:hypothetical protein
MEVELGVFEAGMTALRLFIERRDGSWRIFEGNEVGKRVGEEMSRLGDDCEDRLLLGLIWLRK